MVNAQQLHELDMLIAKAMGKVYQTGSRSGCCEVLDPEWNLYSRMPVMLIFQPTRNPADAMEVLGWITEKLNPDDVVICKPQNWIVGQYCNEFCKIEVWAETLPLAICLFAQRIINTSPSK